MTIRPTLDVVEVLESYEFADSFNVVKRSQTVDNHGIAHDTSTIFYNITGAVVPMNSATLLIQPEGERLTGAIMIYSKFKLSTGKQGGVDADLVVWRHREYIVKETDDFTDYGRGFKRSLCTLHILNPSNISDMD
jgi:hypothetical protein